MGDKFYAVAHGRKPGVYEDWNEVQKQIHDYPQPVYKKFTNKEEAEEFFKARQPERISMEVDESAKKFYAVARGKVIGVFTDYEEVKKHIADYPQPMYKKFEDLTEAKAYFKKYTSGEDHAEDTNVHKEKDEASSTNKDDKKSEGKDKKQDDSHHRAKDNTKEKEKTSHDSAEKNDSKDKADSKEKVYYAVARGHKPGVYATWVECQEQTKDFKGAKFKKFTNEEDAKLFAEGKTLKQIEERKRPHDKEDSEESVEPKKANKEKEKA